MQNSWYSRPLVSNLAAAVERTSVILYQKSVKDVEKCLLHICASFVVFLYFLCLFNSTVVFSNLLCLPYNVYLPITIYQGNINKSV